MVARSFSITAAKQAIKLDSKRMGEVSFTVTNTSEKALRGQLKLRPVEGPSITAAQSAWVTLVGDGERQFAPKATTQVTAKIVVPGNVQPGKYWFRLDAISAVNPDDDLTEGQSVVVEVAAAEAPPPKKFPWWILVVAAVVLLVAVGGGVWMLTRPAAVAPPPVATPAPPTPTPTPTPQAQAIHGCITRTVTANYAGTTWMAQQVCQGNEVAVSGNGFCSQAGQMVGASTTSGGVDRNVWLWCSQSGRAIWYGMCCQQ